MPHDRFFLETPFDENASVDLRSEARHLKVMRLRAGDSLELVNGKNQLAQAILRTDHSAQIVSVETREPPFPIILCQAIPRLNRLDTIVEKGTELGMTELWLFPGKRSEKKQIPLERVAKITIAAMKQCGRLDLPKIVIQPPLTNWETLPYPAYFGDLDPDAPSLLHVFEKKEGTCFFVGPEAGFTDEEEAHLKSLGVQGVNLHPWILRTDTAPLVALSLIQAALK